jgi:hypothetical protein
MVPPFSKHLTSSLLINKFEELTHHQSMQTLLTSQEVFQRCGAANIQLTEEGEPNSLAQLLVYPHNLEMSWKGKNTKLISVMLS